MAIAHLRQEDRDRLRAHGHPEYWEIVVDKEDGAQIDCTKCGTVLLELTLQDEDNAKDISEITLSAAMMEFLEKRCESLCMDSQEDREQMAERLVGFLRDYYDDLGWMIEARPRPYWEGLKLIFPGVRLACSNESIMRAIDGDEEEKG